MLRLILLSLMTSLVVQGSTSLVRTFSDAGFILRSLLVDPVSGSLFSCSQDNTILQWNITTGSLIRTFSGTPHNIYSITVDSGFLFSGAGDYTIRQWNITTGALISILNGHTSNVNSVTVRSGFLFSGAGNGDATVKQWNITTGTWVRTFDCVSGVNTIVVESGFLFAGSNDRNIRRWDINDGVFIRLFSGHTGSIRSIVVNSEYLYSGSDDTTIRQWRISDGGLIRTFTGHISNVWAIFVHSGFLFSGSADTTIRQYRIADGDLVYTYLGHTDSISSIFVADGFLFSGSYDRTIRQWRIPTSADSKNESIITLNLGLSNQAGSRTTIATSTTSIQASIKNNVELDAYGLTLITAVTIAVSLVLFLIITAVSWKLKTRKKFKSSYTETATTNGSPSNINTTNMYGTFTLSGTNHELSIPSFIRMKPDIDFGLQSQIASGGGGAIHICYAMTEELKQRSSNNKLVCKVVSQDGIDAMNETARAAFYQELSIMWRFRDHPNFCKIYAYSEKPASMVLKYYEGGDLASIIHAKNQKIRIPFTTRVVVVIFKAICMAIMEMHQAGFAHCDIKPSNIFIDIQPNAILPIVSDFGITRVLDPSTLKVATFSVSKVRGASIIYAAPEVLVRFRRGINELNPRIWMSGDVFALSITLQEMLQRLAPWAVIKYE